MGGRVPALYPPKVRVDIAVWCRSRWIRNKTNGLKFKIRQRQTGLGGAWEEHCTLQSTAVREELGRKAGEAPIFRILREGGPDLDLENQVGVADFIVYRASSVPRHSRDVELGLFHRKMRTGRSVLLHGLKLRVFTSIVSVLGQIFSCS